MRIRARAIEQHTAKAFWALAIGVLLSLSFYGYLVISTVFLVSGSGKVEKDIDMARSRLSELENTYISLSKGVDIDLAETLGLYPSREEETYITRESAVTAFFENGNEF